MKGLLLMLMALLSGVIGCQLPVQPFPETNSTEGVAGLLFQDDFSSAFSTPWSTD